jgi:hypothetical protein
MKKLTTETEKRLTEMQQLANTKVNEAQRKQKEAEDKLNAKLET